MLKKSLLKTITIALAAVSVGLVSSKSVKAETLKIDREFALERAIEVDVTQLGMVISFNSTVSSVNLSHQGQIIFRGFDGVLCRASVECPKNSAPTMLLVRLIPEIEFDSQLPSVDGDAMLFVNTSSGVYRLKFNPVSKNPKYTKVEIEDKPLPPLFSASR